MFKKITLLVLAAAVALSFSACSIELYERMLITGIGIDYAGDEYTVTVRAADVLNEGEKLITSKGISVYDALNELSLQSGDKQMYTHSNFIVFGKAAAEQGVGDSIDFFLRYFKSNPTIKLYMAEDTAAGILETKKGGKLIPSEDIENLMKSRSYCGKVVKSDMLNFVSQSRDYGRSSIMPVINGGREELSISGTALFNSLKLTGALTESETAGYLAAKGQQKGMTAVIDSEKYGKVTGEAVSSKSKITFGKNFNEVNIDAEISCLLASVTVGRAIDDGDIAEIEELLEDKIKESVISAVGTSYKSGCDALSLAYKLYREEPGYWKKNGEAWEASMRNLKFNVELKVNLNKIGEENRPAF